MKNNFCIPERSHIACIVLSWFYMEELNTDLDYFRQIIQGQSKTDLTICNLENFVMSETDCLEVKFLNGDEFAFLTVELKVTNSILKYYVALKHNQFIDFDENHVFTELSDLENFFANFEI